MAADHQAVYGGLDVADSEMYGVSLHVALPILIRDAGDGGRVIHRIDRQQKTRAGCAPVTVPHCKGDRGRAELIGRRPEGDSAIRSAAAKERKSTRLNSSHITISYADLGVKEKIHVADGEW